MWDLYDYEKLQCMAPMPNMMSWAAYTGTVGCWFAQRLFVLLYRPFDDPAHTLYTARTRKGPRAHPTDGQGYPTLLMKFPF